MENSVAHTKYKNVYLYSEFFLFFSYYKEEPILGIANKAPRKENRRAWVIPLSNAWQYAESKSGEPSQYLIEKSVQIGELLGIGTSKRTVYTIASAIVDALPDLIKMPPAPQKEASSVQNDQSRSHEWTTVE